MSSHQALEKINNDKNFTKYLNATAATTTKTIGITTAACRICIVNRKFTFLCSGPEGLKPDLYYLRMGDDSKLQVVRHIPNSPKDRSRPIMKTQQIPNSK